LIAMAVYLAWVVATYLFEGRVNMMTRPTPLGRAAYVLIANVAIGIGLAGWELRSAVASGATTRKQLGFRSIRRTVIAVVIAGLAGFGLFTLQNATSRDPIVVLNAFAQVLTVSITEVVVCWALVGGAFEALTRRYGRWLSLVVGIISADLFFGVYHFAHSAPFNQVNMVLFLMVPGLVTGLVYFLARDIYATILFHNFLGMLGVIQNIDVAFFSRPLYPLYALMLISIIALVALDTLAFRRRQPQAPQQLTRAVGPTEA
jgi:membrane protease YdiL (CAAX protease family)